MWIGWEGLVTRTWTQTSPTRTNCPCHCSSLGTYLHMVSTTAQSARAERQELRRKTPGDGLYWIHIEYWSGRLFHCGPVLRWNYMGVERWTNDCSFRGIRSAAPCYDCSTTFLFWHNTRSEDVSAAARHLRLGCRAAHDPAPVVNVCVPLYYIPLYFQFVHNDTAIDAAVRLLPFILLLVVSTVAGGYILPYVGYYWVIYFVTGVLNTAGSAMGAGLTYQNGYALTETSAELDFTH